MIDIPLSTILDILTRKQIVTLELLGQEYVGRELGRLCGVTRGEVERRITRIRKELKTHTIKKVWSRDELREIGRQLLRYKHDPSEGKEYDSFQMRLMQERDRKKTAPDFDVKEANE